MSRCVVSNKDVAGQAPVARKGALGAETPAPAADDYKDRLLKYIPAEVIALYITLTTMVESIPDTPGWLPWAIFAFGLGATWLYLWRVGKVHKTLQLAISVGAFFVWAFAMGGPFELTSWYQPYYGALLLPIYTFLVPIVEA